MAALFPTNMAFLTFEWPGHGLSSPLPPGCFYHLLDNVYILRLVMEHFKWKKLALLGHSMSATVAYLFASIYPELVELVICLDSFRPFVHSPDLLVKDLRVRIDGTMREAQRSSEPPTYNMEELVERLYEGSFKSVNKERGLHLLARNIQKSTVSADRYVFTRDNRYKHYNNTVGSPELYEEMARCISAPFLFIRSVDSPFYKLANDDDLSLRVIKSKENCTYLECTGTHHFHFNNPESILQPVLQFLISHAKESFKTNTNSKL